MSCLLDKRRIIKKKKKKKKKNEKRQELTTFRVVALIVARAGIVAVLVNMKAHIVGTGAWGLVTVDHTEPCPIGAPLNRMTTHVSPSTITVALEDAVYSVSAIEDSTITLASPGNVGTRTVQDATLSGRASEQLIATVGVGTVD